jgi:hypothetical protein
MTVFTQVGDVSNTRFWKDWWLHGKRIKEVAPAAYDLVPKRIRNRRTVKEAMLHLRWVSDFQGALTVSMLFEYFELFQELDQVVLQPEVPDKHIWWLSPTYNFSSQDNIYGHVSGIYFISASRKSLENLGPKQVQILYLASGAQ